MTGTRRVAIIGEANSYSGPALALEMARRGHDLVLGDASPGLVEEVTALGANAVDVTGTNHLLEAEGSQRLVDAAMSEFGRIDGATTATGIIVTGRFLNSKVEDLHKVMKGCIEVPYHFMRAVVPVMVAQGSGQVLMQTSAAGGRPTSGRPALFHGARRSEHARAQRRGRGRGFRCHGERRRHQLHGLPRIPLGERREGR